MMKWRKRQIAGSNSTMAVPQTWERKMLLNLQPQVNSCHDESCRWADEATGGGGGAFVAVKAFERELGGNTVGHARLERGLGQTAVADTIGIATVDRPEVIIAVP